jgi:hypothetical protein
MFTQATPRKSIKTIIAFLLSAFSLQTGALELGVGDWQTHGFLSQGYTLSWGNDFFGNSQDAGSLDFTELGINVLGHIHPDVLIAVQGLYRNTAGSDNQGLRLDFANVDYRFPLDGDVTFGLRAGRVKNPFGLYNETRDVVWTRPDVLVPQSVYLDTLALRQAMIASDGGLLYGRYNAGEHAFSAEFVVSEPLDDTGGAAAFLTGIPDVQGSLGGRPMFLGRAGYEWKEGLFRLAFSVVDLDRDFASASASTPSGNFKAFYPLASAQLNLEDWSITGEYGQINIERSGFTPGGLPQKNTSENFYVQIQNRFAPGWSALLRYDVFFANIDDRSGRQGAQLTGLPRHRFYAKDVTAGLRWEFADNFLVAAEYHNVDGTAWLSTVDNPGLAAGGGDNHWDLFTVMMSYRF